MPRFRPLVVLTVLLPSLALTAAAITVRVENPGGSVSAHVVGGGNIEYRHSSPDRSVGESDLRVSRQNELIVVEPAAADGVRIDIDVTLPYGVDFQARTSAGSIEVDGYLRNSELITDTGAIRLRMPWVATRIMVRTESEPSAVTTPRGYDFDRGTLRVGGWGLNDKLDEWKTTYGRVGVQGVAPERLTLEDAPIPEDFPVKLPWQARAALDEMEAAEKQARRPRAAPSTLSGPPAETVPSGQNDLPVFRSEVRIVDLTVTVYDRQGHPLTDLTPEDFEITEDGSPQSVTFAGAEDVPFNLVLLLDLSGSTRRNRPEMKEATLRFIRVARSHDKVAVYALAQDMFDVVSPLTADRQRLAELVEAIPEVGGGTPLYDAIVLAYAEELDGRQNERNAMIVISDGVDNRIYGTGQASNTDFRKLERAAEGWNTLIYPVFLDPYTVVPAPGPARKARRQMQALADSTGGRLFPAQSIYDLDGVYPQVAQELRSVYTVAYYPKNQDFDGSWRRIQVRVKRPGAKVRARDGYFAR